MASDSKTAFEFKEEGNRFYKDFQFSKALDCYTKAIERDNSNSIYFSNRAQCLIRMHLHHTAIADAERAIALDSTQVKHQYRLAIALAGCGEREQACNILEICSKENSDIAAALLRERNYLQNSRGVFDFDTMLQLAKSNSEIDIADYIGPVSIETSKEKGRGLFATRDLNKGELIFVSNAVLLAREPPGTPPHTPPLPINKTALKLIEMLTKLITQSNPLTCARISYLFGSTVHSQPIPISIRLFSPKGYEVIKGHESYFSSETIKKQLIKNVFDIIVKNQSSASTVTYNLPTLTTHPSIDHGPEASGIWFLHSFFNHSCLPNVFISHAGDVCIARTNSRILKGTELTRAYINPNTVDISGLFTIKERKEELKTWEFTCDCELCEFELDCKNENVLRRSIELYDRACQILADISSGGTPPVSMFKMLDNLFTKTFAIAEEMNLRKGGFNDTVWTVIMKLIYGYGRVTTESLQFGKIESYFKYFDRAEMYLCEKDLEHETRFWYIYMQMLISVGNTIPSAKKRKKSVEANFNRVKALQMYF
ncbi:hypothetical protein LOD99_3369 [Oopsacas minuta]|uniref:SET domain-containing protein n=1 Tax=Oopsacas minuta TaxID=111878 RepID=A0AAV7JY83_9METZ|nr:hypothetical protein LOD99_3369 [Oopsacas minuta]